MNTTTVLKKLTKLKSILTQLKDCGANGPGGGGGFQPGNSCAGGGGSSSGSGTKPKPKPNQTGRSDRGSGSSTPAKITTPKEMLPEGKYSKGDPRNDPEYEKYTQELDNKINKYLKEGKDTESLYTTRSADGKLVYTAERRKQHEQLIQQYSEKYSDVPSEKKCWLIGGPSGAGKSTFLRKNGSLLGLEMGDEGPTNAAVLNPDDVKDMMLAAGMVPDYKGLKPQETAALIHEESSYLSKQMQAVMLASGKNVVLDLTVAGRSDKFEEKYVKALAKAGYGKLTAAFVDGDIPTSLYRAGKRHQKPDKDGVASMDGRYVPYDIVASQAAPKGSKYQSGNRETFEQLYDRGSFGSAIVYDNKTEKITEKS